MNEETLPPESQTQIIETAPEAPAAPQHTDRRTRLELAGLLVGISILIFFTPFVLGSRQPAIEASVRQNMDFLLEMGNKYAERNKKPAPNLEALVKDARDNRYNKTFFNPILKNSGDAIDGQVVIQYNDTVYHSLGPDYHSAQNAGKTAYYTDGVKFAIYGHLQEGRLMKSNGQVLSLGNF